MTSTARIDHIVVAVKDSEAAASLLFSKYGLQSYSGGIHPGIGTKNHIVPLGKGYLELVCVHDERAGLSTPFGKAVQAAADAGQHLLTWAVAPVDGVQGPADRLQINANPMKRALPNGGDVSCRITGLQKAVEEPPLPCFILWGEDKMSPDQPVALHEDVEPSGIAWLELTGSQARLSEWLGEDTGLTLVWVKGQAPGIKAVGVATEGEPIVIRSSDFDQKSSLAVIRCPEAAEKAESQERASKDAGVYETALERVEHAAEVAAVCVEHAFEQLTSPRIQHSPEHN